MIGVLRAYVSIQHPEEKAKWRNDMKKEIEQRYAVSISWLLFVKTAYVIV
jgi:hypothetical protein